MKEVGIRTRIATSPLQRMVDSGRARPPRRLIRQVPAREAGPDLSAALAEMRDAERS